MLQTIKLLNGQSVIQIEPEIVHVHSTLVVWPHDGWVSSRMAQAQCVTELMHRNCKQVCASSGILESVKPKCY